MGSAHENHENAGAEFSGHVYIYLGDSSTHTMCDNGQEFIHTNTLNSLVH